MEVKMCDDCHLKCGKGKVDTKTLEKLDKAFATLTEGESSSLLKKYLTPETYELLRDVQTPLGSTLLDCIQSGDPVIGLIAADAEVYNVYRNIIDLIIEEYHNFKSIDTHPKGFWGSPNRIGHLDETAKYVISTRVSCTRSIRGFPFAPRLSKDQYSSIELFIALALRKFEDSELKGRYYTIDNVPEEDIQALSESGLLFKDDNDVFKLSKGYKHWPFGRGLFYNSTKTFVVWVNNKDHLHAISTHHGGDIGSVYRLLKEGMKNIAKYLQFAKNSRFGYLTTSLSNIGTAIKVSVYIRLPKLSKDKERLDMQVNKFNLSVEEKVPDDIQTYYGNVFKISNKRIIGLNEYEIIYEMAEGIRNLIIEEEMCR